MRCSDFESNFQRLKGYFIAAENARDFSILLYLTSVKKRRTFTTAFRNLKRMMLLEFRSSAEIIQPFSFIFVATAG